LSIYYKLDPTLRRVMDYLVPPPGKRLRDIAFRHMAIFGKPGSGKTSTGLALAYIAHHLMAERQPTLTNYIIRAYRLSDAVRMVRKLNPPRYSSFFIIVDDAERYALSYYTRSRATTELILAHDMIRHLLRSCGVNAGVVQLLYLTQRFKNLIILCRNADILGFKATTVSDLSEQHLMFKILGRTYTMQLLKLNYYLDSSWHETFKGMTLFRLPDNRIRWGMVPYIPQRVLFDELDGVYVDLVELAQRRARKKLEEEVFEEDEEEDKDKLEDFENMLKDRLYGVNELAKKLNLTYITIYNAIRRGELKAYRIGGRYKIPESEIIKFMKKLAGEEVHEGR